MKRKKTGLNWEKLRYLDKNGIDIQAHSKSHADLVRLSEEDTQGSRDKLFREIYLAKKAMEIYLGKEMLFFAFPFGKYDLNIIELASIAGYKRVFSTDYGSNVITRNNYSLRRHHIKRNYTLDELGKLIQ
jgi:peptidoglycan/xylan/chitin deacetylase (PgdA/CDA1 family)